MFFKSFKIKNVVLYLRATIGLIPTTKFYRIQYFKIKKLINFFNTFTGPYKVCPVFKINFRCVETPSKFKLKLNRHFLISVIAKAVVNF